MQTLSGYKFKYKFVKGELNILPDLLSHNPAMYPVRGDEDPQVTVISETSVLPSPGSPPLHTPAMVPAPTPSSWPLVLPPPRWHPHPWLFLVRSCTTS
ncbi:hypothetical protein DSO57_1038388 [Entomophthora muscae]|uniref:Uncharacterized protein n=1 Tax=Entomophthora muscae TaxID=34485 RepID=A0ACC2RDE7_9FUNG|nr:hypothetical protein DSO57_1038388 [Entomophthora muscae]